MTLEVKHGDFKNKESWWPTDIRWPAWRWRILSDEDFRWRQDSNRRWPNPTGITTKRVKEVGKKELKDPLAQQHLAAVR
jgi:hypothetical protein